ncbi:MAG: hypothetical protein M3O09_00100 [Acidobacteriota bacterium]|nr:hypothetical protein [Acidobacteriota bacterium]
MRFAPRISKIKLAILLSVLMSPLCAGEVGSLAPGSRVVMDAHNCYPYDGMWTDRIERALKTAAPLAIEQDLLWYTEKRSGKSWSIVSHGKPARGTEPTMCAYFFERIRPMMEQALREGNSGAWPLITLNLDFKSDEPAHHAAVWQLLKEYEAWICSTERVVDINKVMPLTPKPLLVLTGEADSQERDFYGSVPVGERLLVFGAVHVRNKDPMAAPEVLVPGSANNYRRWWNNPWEVVERGGQRKAGAWTELDDKRLRQLVAFSHARGLWIRFYTLNGLRDRELKKNGWDKDYNFGSKEKVLLRWTAAIDAGVDFLATDQYEDVAELIRSHRSAETVPRVPAAE